MPDRPSQGAAVAVLRGLPFQFVVPRPIRESELVDFTPTEWAVLERGGMETHGLPPEQMANAFALKRQYGRLSANDCFSLVIAQWHEGSVLLTGDRAVRTIATELGVRVHGVLWVVDKLQAANACDIALLTEALETWKSGQSVFLPESLINRRVRERELDNLLLVEIVQREALEAAYQDVVPVL